MSGEKDDPNFVDFVRMQIEAIRQKLLDTSKRNRLISFRHNESSRDHVRVIDELHDFLFQNLKDGKTFKFKSLPDPNEREDEDTDEFRAAMQTASLEDENYLKAMEELGDERDAEKIFQIEKNLRDSVRMSIGLKPIVDWQDLTPAEYARKLDVNPSYEMPMQSNDEDRERPAKFPL
jgi:hypothetical protein